MKHVDKQGPESNERAGLPASIRGHVLSALGACLGIPPAEIDPSERFHRYGLDSLRAARLVADLAARLGNTLYPTIVWDHPTVNALVRHLAGGGGEGGHEAAAPGAAAADEPIAVVGLSCRLPRAADREALWALLSGGVDAVTEVPADRWPADRYYDPDPWAPGKMSTRWGGFLDQVDRFDAGFFKISPREAADMDPQQRLALELAWEALEDAGIPPGSLRDTRTGVFFGQMWSDYLRVASGHPEAFGPHTATGQDTSIIGARISYVLGLSGPSLVVNTACSSALVALHLACQSLRSGEVSLALVGGVNMLLTPETTVLMTKFGAMAPDGRSKAFGTGQSGYVRGEGGAVVVLRRLSDTVRAGDRVYCVVRASAVNNDGFSNGLTAPNPAAQQAVLREAYHRAGIAPEKVGYVEAHGTGTFLGDTIEARALGAVLGRGRTADRPLLIGSIKSNIGHLEAASGAAGLAKVVLALHHRRVPPSLHARPPSPDIPFEALHLRVPDEVVPWPEGEPGDLPVAGINSFGFGGTNCHAVLQGVEPETRLFVLSAPDREALRAAAGRALERLRAPAPGPSLAEACAEARRAAPGPERLAIAARSTGELARHLGDFLEDRRSHAFTAGTIQPGGLVFVYSGHGGQWQGMGRELIACSPVFRAAVERCDAALRRWTGFSVLDELLAPKDRSRLPVFEVAQTTLFTIQVALGELWRSLGVVPDRVVGHSVGEVAAAHFAGVLDLDDAAQVIFHRSRLGSRNTGKGGMLAVELSYEDALRAIEEYGERLCVAVRSSPTSHVLSGDLDAVEHVARRLEERGARVHRIDTSQVAGHSRHMDPLCAELSGSLRGIRPRAGEVPIVSTVTAGLLPGQEWGAEYWARNLREMVCLSPAIERLASEGCSTFLEIGPHPVLSQAVRATLAHRGRPGPVVASLARGEDGAASIARAAGALHVAGRLDAPPPDLEGGAEREGPGAAELLLVSAHTEKAVRERAAALAEALLRPDAPPLRDVACTAAARRDHGPCRIAVVAATRAQAASALREAASAEPPPSARAAGRRRPRHGLFFPAARPIDRGSLGPLLRFPAFRDALERAERALDGASPSPVQRALAALVEAVAGPPAAVLGDASAPEGALPDPAEPIGAWLVVGCDEDVPAALAAVPEPGKGGLLPLQGRDGELLPPLLAALGVLYTLGAAVDGRALHPGGGRLARLPDYPWQRERHWLSIASSPAEAQAPAAPEAAPLVAPRLRGALPGERRSLLSAFVAGQVRAVLGIDPSKPVDPGAPLREMGLGSMLAVQLRTRLGQGLGCELYSSILFDYPTVDALAAHLEAELFGAPRPALPAPAGPPERAPAPREDGPVPIAVVGVGCRFPGASGPEAFWHLLRSGVDAIREVPASRWRIDEWYDPDLTAPGKMSTRWGGFLDDIEAFDPRFFGLSPAEAARMDPQQRLVLEVAWEALEHAGIARESLAGTDTGVFIGISALDFAQLLGGTPTRAGTGMIHCIAANRLSYSLDLRGPSVAVDTACSSSLVAVHMACQSLRSGESDAALAGGVNVLLSPEWTACFSEAGMMAADGRCKSFDAAADGYVRGEGCGVVVLKRLPDALRDGDAVLAVIRGSAVNQDGRSNGLTAPNGLAQQAVIRRALAAAGVEPADVDYIESHGSGTPLGDAIEVQSLSAVLGAGRRPGRRFLLGSVKTNIGHLESAAGIAGLIKCVLSVHHAEIPPHLHLRRINPSIDLDRMPLAIPTAGAPWPETGRPRRAGVSSFGIGGTNAHVVVEQAPEPAAGAPEDGRGRVLVLSAQSEPALRALAGRYAAHLERRPGTSMASLCATAATGRARLPHRLAIPAPSAPEAAAALSAFARGEAPEGAVTGHAAPAARPKIAFLFTGQGAQYAGMGRALVETQPVFRRALEACAEILRPRMERPLLDLLLGSSRDAGAIDRTEHAQPALFAIEYALYSLFRSWGITPSAVLGHSVGEYAAACAASVLSLEDALRLVAERGRLMGGLPEGGAMAAAFAPEGEVEQAIGDLRDRVSIAAVNGPKNVVLSGDREAVEAACDRLEEAYVVTRPMRTSHAFHSARMEPVLGPFFEAAQAVTFRPPEIPLVSNLTGERLAPGETLSADYLRRHLRAPVRFADGMAALDREGCDLFIEIGPHDTLIEMGRRCLPGGARTWIASMRRGEDPAATIEAAAAAAFVAGAPIDWAAFWRAPRPRRAALPTYPFERRPCWPDPSELRRPRDEESTR